MTPLTPVEITVEFRSMREQICRVAVFIGMLGMVSAHANESGDLVTLINEFRAAPASCGNQQRAPVGPLAPDDTLAGIPVLSSSKLQVALQQSGYQAAALQAISVSGPTDAITAMNVIKQRYCSALLNDEYAQVGVSREGATWQLILARPLLSASLGDWKEAGRELLQRVNQARATPRKCGSDRFAAAPALRWNERLAEAAHAHSRDMANKDYFSHQGKDGSHVGERAGRAGYVWLRVGENIAAGQGSVEQAISGWLASPGHCVNIMNPDFTEMGAAYAINTDSKAVSYWTQVFGTPR